MMHLAKTLVPAMLALAIVATPAMAADPTGVWQSTSGESQYKVSYCGDGTQLCAKLTWLREDAQTDENLAYLNRYVLKGATAIDEDEWEGAVIYEGESYAGSVRLVGDNDMRLRGCKGMLCQSMIFNRISGKVALN